MDVSKNLKKMIFCENAYMSFTAQWVASYRYVVIELDGIWLGLRNPNEDILFHFEYVTHIENQNDEYSIPWKLGCNLKFERIFRCSR